MPWRTAFSASGWSSSAGTTARSAPGADQCADRVQRVEQEVRPELQLERVQPRLGERRLELRRAQLVLAVARVPADRGHRERDERVDEQLDRQVREQHAFVLRVEAR